jgi:hypothetical protein
MFNIVCGAAETRIQLPNSRQYRIAISNRSAAIREGVMME